MSHPVPFVVSVEVTAGKAEQSGFHAGTIETIARQICVDRYHARVALNLPVVTVALLDARGAIVDVYLGDCWSSELMEDVQ